MFKKLVLFGLLFAIVSASAAFAANEPYVISFQGKLSPAPATPDIIFRLFNNGGNTDTGWIETQTGVIVDANGIFNVVLGDQMSLENLLSTNPAGLWLEISVNGTPLTPKRALTAAPYAVVAKKVYGDTTGNIVYAKSSNDNAVNAESSGQYDEAAVKAVGKGTSARAIIATADGRAIQATSGNNFAIVGYKADDADNDALAAVIGQNNETNPGQNPGVQGVSVVGYGVYGYSTNSIGVRGTGATAGGSFESTSGISIYGYKADDADNDANPAIYGKNDETDFGDNPGVKGESKNGYGLYGFKNNDATGNKAAVYGWNRVATTGINPGVRGVSTNGYGVYGHSTNSIGVEGVGATAGGSFESTSGYGVYGTSTSGIGVRGTGATAGGSFESTSGYGVYGNSTSGDGLYGKSTNGAALSLGVGKIKIDNASSAPVTQSGNSVTINKAVGKVHFDALDDTVIVYNSQVTSSSIIILSPMAISNFAVGYFAVRPSSGSFSIFKRDHAPGTYAACDVAFLVIN